MKKWKNTSIMKKCYYDSLVYGVTDLAFSNRKLSCKGKLLLVVTEIEYN